MLKKGILSIQSHVAYGYVGNKAAVYPLQMLGYDVWPIHTVQFSNHTGYKKWQGQLCSGKDITNLVEGIEELGIFSQCRAILSGYLGNKDICKNVFNSVKRLKEQYGSLIYLCDPVIGNTHCYVPTELADYIKTNLNGDIITPNHFEAETLSGIKIHVIRELKSALNFFHELAIPTVIFTGVVLKDTAPRDVHIVASNGTTIYFITSTIPHPIALNGTGDLFSALYLGYFLHTNDLPSSLQLAHYYVNKAIEHTMKVHSDELQVTSINYAAMDLPASSLPRITTI